MRAFQVSVALLLLACALESYGEHVAVDHSNDEAAKTEKTSESAAVADTARTDESQVEPANIEHDNQAQSETEEPNADHRPVPGPWDINLDRFLQALGIIGLLVVIWQTHKALEKAAHANDIAREAGNDSLRPWLSFTGEKAATELTLDEDDGVYVEINFDIENVGHTPATGCVVLSEIVAVPVGQSPFTLFEAWRDAAPDVEGTEVCDIFPSAKVVWPEVFRVPRETLEQEFGDDILIDLHVFVCIFYRSHTIPEHGMTAQMSQLAWNDEADIMSHVFGAHSEYPEESIRFLRSSNSVAR